MSVLVVDYGMGNLASARRSFEECGARVIVSDSPDSIADAERIVIPGVGAFKMAMERLNGGGWVEPLRQAALVDGLPVLGICLGMQILAEDGDEGGVTPGLGLIPGRVERLHPVTANERVPHVGWNEVHPVSDAPLFTKIAGGSDFYFVHSYHFVPTDPATVLARTPYCGEVVSAVGRRNVVGVQFHPEKSSRAGFQLIRNFMALTC